MPFSPYTVLNDSDCNLAKRSQRYESVRCDGFCKLEALHDSRLFKYRRSLFNFNGDEEKLWNEQYSRMRFFIDEHKKPEVALA